MEIAGIQAKPGTTAFGELRVSENPSGTSIGIPVIVVQGVQERPLLLVDSSIHGQEITGSLAIKKLLRNLDPWSLKGTLVCVPCVNTPAFDALARVNILERDPRNMDQVFPGQEMGILAEMTAYRYYNELVSKSDYLISFHTGGPYLCPIDCVALPPSTTPEVDRKSEELARAFGLERIWNTFDAEPEYGGSLIEVAARNGIPGIVAEVGCQTAWYDHAEEFITTSVRGINNVMKHLGMLPGVVEAPPRYLYTKGQILPLRNRRGGIWETGRHLGDSVEKDGVIGRIIGLANDEVLEVVIAPFDGVLFDIRVWPIAYPGELLGHFAAGEVRE